MNQDLTLTIEECEANYKAERRKHLASLIAFLSWELSEDLDDAEEIAREMHEQIQYERYGRGETPLPPIEKFL